MINSWRLRFGLSSNLNLNLRLNLIVSIDWLSNESCLSVNPWPVIVLRANPVARDILAKLEVGRCGCLSSGWQEPCSSLVQTAWGIALVDASIGKKLKELRRSLALDTEM